MSLEIYIGAAVEHDSERRMLAEIERVWSTAECRAVVLANINIAGRQVDAVAVCENLVIVLEAKHYSRAVRGDTNGPWQVQVASSQWRECDNAFLQVLGEKNALRDAMRAFDGAIGVFYPEASVVIVPAVPQGSELTAGDFKASIIGLSALRSRLLEERRNCWTLERWREFAEHLRLRRVSSLSTALSPAFLQAEAGLGEYVQRFSLTYSADGTSFIESPALPGDGMAPLATAVERQLTDGANVLVTGPSGCGKTLLGKQAGIAMLGLGGVPIHLRAHEFEGRLKDLLVREVGLLTSTSAAEILAATRRLGRPLTLIVDGYNECKLEHRATLVRAIAAMARRYSALVLVTSQLPLAHAGLLAATTISIPPPSMELKRAIATNAMGGKLYTPNLDDLLESVASGLEAHLIGSVGSGIGAGASRFAIFDAFVRERLGVRAREGIKALTMVAGWFTDHRTFSISVRDLDRLLQEGDIATVTVDALVEKRLLVCRGDRMIFSHELFLNAFAAESVLRRADGDMELITTAINSPVYADSAALIVGAVDDHGLLLRILESLANAELLRDCKVGRCGTAAREWIEAKLPLLLDRMGNEIRELKFRIDTSEWSREEGYFSFDDSWNENERALIACLPDLVASGTVLNEVLRLAGAMDDLIASEAVRLRDVARAANIGLRGAMFAATYVGQGPNAPGISQVCARLHGGLFNRAASAELISHMSMVLATGNVSPGQLNLLVGLSRSVEATSEVAAALIAWGLTTYWRRAPYHLRLALLDAAGYRGEAPAQQKTELITALEALLGNENPFLNTLIFESLQRLGASEVMEAEHVESVRQQLAQLLARSNDESAWAEARNLFNCQFDHPYSNAYWEAVHELLPEQHNLFTLMAAKGSDKGSFFLGLLLQDVYAVGGPAACEILRRWTSLPPVGSVAPQEAIESFVIAHQFLGRLRGDLPERERRKAEGTAAEALRACGELLYWANRIELSIEERRASGALIWQEVGERCRGAMIVALHMCTDWHMMINRGESSTETIPEFFANESAAACRWALENPSEQVDYFPRFIRPFGRSALAFAVKVLGEYGNSMDLGLLRTLSLDPELGRGAISAIRMLEDRTLAS